MRYIQIAFILISLNTWSQDKGLIYYGHIESPGMRSPAGPDLNAYLVFNKDESYYVTAKDSLENGKKTKNELATGGDMVIHNSGSNTFRFGKQVHYNRAKDSLWWSQRFRGNIYVSEKRPVINWKLEKETKQFGDFTAHKAIGKFRGRTYTAWYILEIPLPYGPWKLNGLPGLIVEAYDERKEMYLYFKSIEYPTKNKATISQVKRPDSDKEGWKTIKDFENMLRKSLERAYNNTVIISQKNGGGKPNELIFSDIYIESF